MFPFLTKKRQATKRVERRSLENPNISLSNADYWGMFGASPNAITVNKKTALSIPAFNAATGRRGRTIGSLSCKIFEKTDKGLEAATDHPLYNLLNRRPHPLINRAHFWTAFVCNLDTDGEAFAEVVRKNGVATQLNIIQKSDVKDIQLTPEGNYFFIVEKEQVLKGRLQTVKKSLSSENMIWVRDLSFDGITPLNKVQTFKTTLATGIAANQYSNKFFEGGAQIPFAVESPLAMSPAGKTRFYQEFERLFSGIKNFFKRPFILDKGMKLHQLKMTPQEAEMTTTKKQVTEETARIHDVPAHMIGAGERFTFSSIEMMQTDFVQYSLRNTIIQIQLELENKLLSKSEQGQYKIKFNLDSLLQGDIKTRTEKLINEYKWGLLQKNEYRKMSGYLKDEGGDIYFNPVNMFVSKKDETPLNPAIQNDKKDE